MGPERAGYTRKLYTASAAKDCGNRSFLNRSAKRAGARAVELNRSFTCYAARESYCRTFRDVISRAAGQTRLLKFEKSAAPRTHSMHQAPPVTWFPGHLSGLPASVQHHHSKIRDRKAKIYQRRTTAI